MKSIFLICLICIVASTFIYIKESLSHSNSAPIMDCMSCHQGDLKSDLLTVIGMPKTYTPGKSYSIKISVKSELQAQGEPQGGFALEASGGKIVVSDKKNTQIIGSFLTHTLQGAQKRDWSFTWQAPKGKEDVTITIMAVASNGDYSPFGEEIGAQSFTIKASAK